MAASNHFIPRTEALRICADAGVWDLLVIGGGATGLGVALHAAAQGCRVLLLEACDYAAGTSSHSTKLLHGGVRYLAQGHWGLVRDALRERQTVLTNASAVARSLEFLVPAYSGGQALKYLAGLGLYQFLAGARSLGATRWLSVQAHPALSLLQPRGLRGAIRYVDGQFDDAALALALRSAIEQNGGLTLNHAPVIDVQSITGGGFEVRWRNALTGTEHMTRAACVVDATGGWLGPWRSDAGAEPAIELSRGSHLVVDASFWPHDQGLLIPETRDGRVLFVLPWHGHTLIGTTDVPVQSLRQGQRPTDADIDFILTEVSRYLRRSPKRSDITSVWAGVRTIVKPKSSQALNTSEMGREHAIWTSSSGVVCVAGGKWTTYRLMAEQVVAHCRRSALLRTGDAGRGTQHLALISGKAFAPDSPSRCPPQGEALSRWVVEQVRDNQACTVEDVLARRSRLLLLDARQAGRLAPAVDAAMRSVGVANPGLEEFQALVNQHLPQDQLLS
ncbi:MAG: glycerol-3-phosphate dehydrogenase/oxidase [Alphaproteobacteria bacterium]|nr:glycerol-3-phosphate dehydrogenase/oxidase [Alphaproteobacteria bacterium]